MSTAALTPESQKAVGNFVFIIINKLAQWFPTGLASGPSITT